MKLLTKSTSYLFISSIFVMIAGGIFLFYTIRIVIYKQIDNSLITEKTIIQDQIEKGDSIPDFSASFGHQIEVRLLNTPLKQSQIIKDTIIYNSDSREFLPFRTIFFSSNTRRGKGFIISIFQTLSENQELLKDISLLMFILFLSLLFISILMNYLISRRLWSPFYHSVNQAGNYNILSNEPLDLPDTNINEFMQLNKVFKQMTQKMRNDYLNLKEYNENASHEIQTPLAVIRSKMELLMQNKNLKKDDLEYIKSINEATTRLFKLNQGLLLISKIENQYFHETKEISLRRLMENYIDNYKEIIHIKNIRIEFDGTDQALVMMNDVLSDILISNLLSNAVRYNIDGGFIKCVSGAGYISVANSGLPLSIEPEMLFRRFHKGSDNPQSVGLGLSIVKKIADYYNMKVTYESKGNIHEIKIYYQHDLIS